MIFSGQIGPHRLILSPARNPAPFGQGERGNGIADQRIVGAQQRFALFLRHLIGTRLAKLAQHQRDTRAHLHMSEQGRAKHGGMIAEHPPADRIRPGAKRGSDSRGMIERNAQRHFDRRQTATQMPPRLRDQRVVTLAIVLRKEKGQVDGMTDRHGGHARQDSRHRPAIRHGRTGEGRKDAHAVQHNRTSLKCTKPSAGNLYGRRRNMIAPIEATASSMATRNPCPNTPNRPVANISSTALPGVKIIHGRASPMRP